MPKTQWKHAFRRAQATWPEVRVDEAKLKVHLETLGWIGSLPHFFNEVFLTYACGCGSDVRNEAAFRVFDAVYLPIVKMALRALSPERAHAEELLQIVRERLFVGPPPRLLKYSGRAPLDAWLRLVTKRVAMDSWRAAERHSRTAESDVTRSPPVSTLESDLDRLRHQALLRTALPLALQHLEARDRNILRLHYEDGLSVDALSRAYGVHRATMARWLKKTHVHLRVRLKDALGGVSEPRLLEIARAVPDRTDLQLFALGSGSSGESSRSSLEKAPMRGKSARR